MNEAMKHYIVFKVAVSMWWQQTSLIGLVMVFIPSLLFAAWIGIGTAPFTVYLAAALGLWQLDRLGREVWKAFDNRMTQELTMLLDSYEEILNDLCEDLHRSHPEVLHRHGIRRNEEIDVSMLNERDEQEPERDEEVR